MSLLDESLTPPRPARARGRVSEPHDPLAYADEDDSSWLLPYVDVISLLLAFLILTLAMAKVNPRKFEELSSKLTRHKPPPSTLAELKATLDATLRAEHLQEAVVTTLDDDGLRAVFRSDGVLFESGQADITPVGHALMDKVIAVAGKALGTRHQVAIEGHTDDVPIHTSRFDSNWDLSAARATVMLKSFLAAGFDAHKLSAQGFADTRPARALPAGTTDAAGLAKARAENRRVVVRIYERGTP
jgi:chemotaxis protein MotB